VDLNLDLPKLHLAGSGQMPHIGQTRYSKGISLTATKFEAQALQGLNIICPE
jgi:hypothetical protein